MSEENQYYDYRCFFCKIYLLTLQHLSFFILYSRSAVIKFIDPRSRSSAPPLLLILFPMASLLVWFWFYFCVFNVFSLVSLSIEFSPCISIAQ